MNNFREISERQDKLRKERNELQSQVNAKQNEIDKLEMEKYDVTQFLGKVIYLEQNSVKSSYHIYLKVNKIERLINGPKFLGPYIEISREGNNTKYINIHSSGFIDTYKWDDIMCNNITIVSSMQEIKDDILVAQANIDVEDLPMPVLDGEVQDKRNKFMWFTNGK